MDEVKTTGPHIRLHVRDEDRDTKLTMIVPYPNFRRACEALEPVDLSNQILMAKKVIEEKSVHWEPEVAAMYGLTAIRVLGMKGFKSPIQPSWFMSFYSGAPEPPAWLERFCPRHRSFLTLLGWLKYFEARGCKHYWCEQNKVAHPQQLVQTFGQPKQLLHAFQTLDKHLDSFVEIQKKVRTYSKFTELPAAYKLTP